MLRRWWQGLRGRRAPGGVPDPEDARPSEAEHVPGRARLVFRDGSVVEAQLEPEAHARLEYLARRAVAPRPPEPNEAEDPL